ncbi:MAG: NAD(P)H-hydrate dehydratase [Bacteroidales bacterium]|jgi:NAD(P)H-hydrate epimerase|nr:NAD(P)H-hydrate dehydratase [Bacteroidales bacterium]
MKIFTCSQIREIDQYTIKHEPIASADLMERAATRLYEWFSAEFDRSVPVYVFSGTGNNGGDGLALARLLAAAGYTVSVYCAGNETEASPDWKINRERLAGETSVPFVSIREISDLPVLPSKAVIVDALFGSGLSRPVTGIAKEVIRYINSSGCVAVSVDIPSGLFGEDNRRNDQEAIVKASITLTFQFPKLSFMFPENEKYTGKWHVLPIGLHREKIENLETPYVYTEVSEVRPLIRERHRFDHKGSFGHALLAGGSYGKMGAVILGSRAALKTGAGLLTCRIPGEGNLIMQCSVPEAMTLPDNSARMISSIGSSDAYDAAGIGPGMGTAPETADALFRFLLDWRKPLVLDADALNILALNRDWLKLLPPFTVLTPHPGEFARMAGDSKDSLERLEKQKAFSKEFNCIVVLKGANTSVSEPDGKIWFNSTGNPGMATAGSGDTLTGMILSLLAQGYDPPSAATAGVWLHGMAGDIAASRMSHESLIASDIIESIGSAFGRIRGE